MAKTAPKPAPAVLTTERRIAKTAAEKATESLREKIVVALVGFVLTGVIGTVLTTWIQQRGWAWQNRVAKIDKDTEAAIATYRATSDLINTRWHATFRMVRALERGTGGEAWTATRTVFENADRDWALRYTNVSREIEFFVDTPFGIEPGEMLKPVWGLSCDAYALRGTPGSAIDSRSARVVLEVINHCHGITKDELEKLADARGDGAQPAKPADAAVTVTLYRRLEHLYRTNDALRCLIFERALAVRESVSTESYWSTFFGVGAPRYAATLKERDCAGA
ncbi:MAG: hypothetical protein ACRCUE_05280 [Bosea sp. (in: a-proteobacteria)]